jgi:hypothetical protein
VEVCLLLGWLFMEDPMLMSIKSCTRDLTLVFLAILLAACSSSNSPSAATGADASSTSNLQTPPTNGHDVETWLQARSYKSWHCEAAPHPARSPSPHGMNRICSNDLTSSFSGTGERPQGTAAVKELYDDAAVNVVGYAVYLKTQATSAQGGNWYFYERVPTSSMAPHDSQGVVADGLGTSGPSKMICVGCHAGAGSDAPHTPSPGAGDEVYTQVH